jgi:hypothetical protein
MNDDLKSIWKGAVVAEYRFCSGIFVERLRKPTRNLSQYSRCPGRDSNRAPPEYKSRALHLDQSAINSKTVRASADKIIVYRREMHVIEI